MSSPFGVRAVRGAGAEDEEGLAEVLGPAVGRFRWILILKCVRCDGMRWIDEDEKRAKGVVRSKQYEERKCYFCESGSASR